MQRLRTTLTIALAVLSGASSASAQTTYHWTNAGTGGPWSTGANWTPVSGPGVTFPGAGDTANLIDATDNRVIALDATATASVGTINWLQTAAFTNTLEVTRAGFAVTNAITLGATGGGTSELRLSPTTANSVAFTAPSVTVNAGGLLTMGGNLNGSTNYTSQLSGSLVLGGGTVAVTAVNPSPAAAVTRVVTGTFTMTSGTVTFDTTGTTADTRFQVNGNASINGGTFTRVGTRTPQLILSGATADLNPTGFDPAITASFSGGNQTVNIGTGVGAATTYGGLLIRGFGAGPFTKTVTAGANATFAGGINIGNNVNGSTTVLRLGSNINQTLATGQPLSNADAPNPGTFSPTLDTNGFSLTSASTTTWAPGNISATRLSNWNVINSGTAGQGVLRVAGFNFTAANQVDVGAGVTLEAGGNGTTTVTSDLGGNGTVSAGSTFRVASPNTGTVAHVLNSNRGIGSVELRGAAPSHTLTLENDATWAVQGTLRATQGTVTVNQTNKFGTGVFFSSATAPAGTDPNASTAQVVFQALSTATAYASAVPFGFSAIPAGHSGRSTFRLRGNAGDTSSLTLSGAVTLPTAGAANVRVQFGAEQAGQLLDITGPVTGGATLGNILVNGSNTGVGTVRFSNAGNSFATTLVVVNGTLLSAHSNALGTGTANLLLADGATPAAGATVRALTDGNGVAVARNIVLGNTASAGAADAYVLGGNAAGSSSFSGGVSSSANALNRNLQLTAAPGGVVDFTGNIGPNPDAAGVVNVTKTGPGTVRLGGVNTYDGTTTVGAGRLEVGIAGAGSIASGVAATGTAVIGGSGTITGGVTVAGTAGIAPGNSAGVLTVHNGALALSPGATYAFEIDAAGPAAAAFNDGGSTSAGHDRINVTGTGTASFDSLNLTIAELPNFASSFDPANPYSWSIVTTPGGGSLTVTGTATVNTALAPTLAAALAGGGVLSLNTNGGVYNLNYTPAPEPAAVLLVCGAVGLGVRTVRRKRT